MTAEIAILNKEAIALASDSAVTLGGSNNSKIFTSANKLFELSKYQPIGIMIFGNAELIGVPWETIIKCYRTHYLKDNSFDTVKEYAENFIDFLDKENLLFSEKLQYIHFLGRIHSYYNYLCDEIKRICKKRIEITGNLSKVEEKKITFVIIDKHFKKWTETQNIKSIPNDFNEKLIKKYEKEIEKAIVDVFENLEINPTNKKKLKQIGGCLFSKFPKNISNQYETGLVITGFGKSEIFPALVCYEIGGIAENRLLFREHYLFKIDEIKSGAVFAFAQSEMVCRFMDGVDPDYLQYEEKYLETIFEKYAKAISQNIGGLNDIEKEVLRKKLLNIGKTIKKEFIVDSRTFIDGYFSNPIKTVVASLPKNEIAAMAESLVSITSFKRKVSMQTESVSGPVDVAIISKGDGFIWIKRKYYFDPNLNPQFFRNMR